MQTITIHEELNINQTAEHQYQIIEPVAGTSFRSQLTYNDYDGIAFVENGMLGKIVSCRFVPEPTNQYDPNAVRVEALTLDNTYHHVGYLPKEGTLYPTIIEPTYGELKIVFYSQRKMNDSFRIVQLMDTCLFERYPEFV